MHYEATKPKMEKYTFYEEKSLVFHQQKKSIITTEYADFVNCTFYFDGS